MRLFDFDDFPPRDCVYCRVLPSGRWTRHAEHAAEHEPVECSYCGAWSQHRAAHERDHGNGRTWTRFGETRPICTSLQLRINQARLDPAPYLLAMERNQ